MVPTTLPAPDYTEDGISHWDLDVADVESDPTSRVLGPTVRIDLGDCGVATTPARARELAAALLAAADEAEGVATLSDSSSATASDR